MPLNEGTSLTQFKAGLQRPTSNLARWQNRFLGNLKPEFYDSADRADSASALGTADSGQAWATVSNTWGIAGRRLIQKSTSGEAVARVALTQPADFMQADVFLNSVSIDAGLLIRCVDATNYLLAEIQDTPAIRLWAVVAGAYTSLNINTTHIPVTVGGMHVFRCDYQRGTGVITATLTQGGDPAYHKATVTATLNSTQRNLFELDTHVGLRSGNADVTSAYQTLLAGAA